MLLRAALKFAQRGLRILPCAARGKIPITAHGVLDASSDPDTVEQWWRSEPNANIGIATGKASRIFAIDVDGLEAESELHHLEAEHAALPPTVEVITARGRHLYFRTPAGVSLPNSASKIADGIDVRGDGGYVLAPPSVHPSGKRYCWSVDSANMVADAPDWLLERIAPSAASNGSTPPAAWREIMAGVAEGARNQSAARLAGYLLRRYVDAFVVLEVMQLWNAARCSPPLPEADIMRVVDSIARRELQRRHADGQ